MASWGIGVAGFIYTSLDFHPDALQADAGAEIDASKGYALSVSDDGPGLPVGFDLKKSKGLGMSIISSLVKEIGGELLLVGNAGHGTCFTVLFSE